MIRTDIEGEITAIPDLEELLEKTTLPGQREAITARGPLVVVSAGAGTGKTWTLAWRFVWAIATGRAKVNEILTLTFTEKAAMEMKERIGELLLEVANKLPSLSPRLKEAGERIDEAFISTLHSFSMRVIKEDGLALELDPESRPAGIPEEEYFWREIESRIDYLDHNWFGKRIDGKWISRQKKIFEDELLVDLVNSYGKKNITDLAREVLSLWASRGETPEDLWQFSENLRNRDEEVLQHISRIYAPVFEEEWCRWTGPQGIIANLPILRESNTKLAKKLLGLHSKWGNGTPESEDLHVFFLDLMEALKGASGKAAGQVAEELGCPVSDYRKDFSEYMELCQVLLHGIDGRDQKTRSSLLKISALFWQIWEGEKKRKALLSFDDMISKAIEALEAGNMSDRFREVLVDEFQDTNRLQDLLLKKIVNKGSTATFIVGDLKQSIYRFRHAEPSLFLEYINEARRGKGKYINLDVSFRSSGKVLEGINDTFAAIWKKGLGKELLHPYEPLKSPTIMDWHGKRQKVQTPPVEALVEFYPPEEEKTSAEEKRLHLSRRLAHELLRMKNEEALIWDKKEVQLRPVQWRDMAILVPTRNQYGALEKAFTEEMSIPCYFESNLGYYSRSEVQDILSLVNYLADPRDITALAAFLSSPFSGLSLEKTGSILKKTREIELPLPDILLKEDPALFGNLERWRRIANLEGVSHVFSMIISKTEIIKAFPAWKRKKAVANLRKAIDITREYENSMGRDLGGCSDYLSGSLGRGIAMEDADSTGEKENVVRVMTVHASKGLEFPVLAIMGMEYFPGKRSTGTSLSPSGILGVTPSKYPNGMKKDQKDVPSSPVLAAMMEKQEQLEEWQRLFYVAATRARDSLLLCGIMEAKEGEHPRPKDGTWLSMISQDNLQNLTLHSTRIKPANKSLNTVSEPEEITSVKKPDPGRQYLARISATSYGLFKFCSLAWRMRYRQGRELTWELPGRDGQGGADLGSLAHWILMKWDFREETLEQFLPHAYGEDRTCYRFIPTYLLPEWERADSRKVLRKWLIHLSRSETGKELRYMLGLGLLHKEIPFRLKMNAGPLLTGAMDLLWEKDGVLNIRDYKITALENTPEELYLNQMLFYGWTASHAFKGKEPLVDMRLIHLREGIETERISLPPGGMDEIGEDILDTAIKAVNGPFEPELKKCPSCPFRKDCPIHKF